MDIKQKQKVNNKHLDKLSNALLAFLVITLAIILGVQCGNIWYKLDVNLVTKIDSESFKSMVKVSLPIMESVYNSGKSSVSFSGEVKDLFAKVFNFDLDSPTTILNAQSPLFMNFQNIGNKSLLAQNDAGEEQSGDNQQGNDDAGPGGNSNITGDTGAGSGQGAGDGTGNGMGTGGGTGDGTGDGTGTGNGTGDGTGDGTGSGSSQVTGEGTSNGTGTDDSTSNEDGKGSGTGEGTSDGQNSSKPGQATQPGESNSQQVTNSQPISSIAFDEDENEKEEDSNLVSLDKIVLRNFTNFKIDIDELLKKPLNLSFSKKGPKVLIYHTHTTESYVIKESDLGKKDVPSHNTNPRYNVVRVGEELTRNLEKKGIETLHNGTVHKNYSASIGTIKSYMKSHTSIQVFIDLHRDAVGEDKPKLRMVKKINGKNAAQIMFVVGADGTLPHPEWKENLKFVLKLQQKLNEKYPGLAKPVWIVAKRYNQQVSNQAILIEVGGDGNLLSECLESTKYLAEALDEVMSGE